MQPWKLTTQNQRSVRGCIRDGPFERKQQRALAMSQKSDPTAPASRRGVHQPTGQMPAGISPPATVRNRLATEAAKLRLEIADQKIQCLCAFTQHHPQTGLAHLGGMTIKTAQIHAAPDQGREFCLCPAASGRGDPLGGNDVHRSIIVPGDLAWH